MISDSDKCRLQVGFKQVLKSINEDKAEKVYLASDCENKICEPIRSLCGQKCVSLITVDTMKELGEMCGIEVKASCAAVVR